MQGRRENEHLYHAGLNICKYKLFSKAFFNSSGRNDIILIVRSYEPFTFFIDGFCTEVIIKLVYLR